MYLFPLKVKKHEIWNILNLKNDDRIHKEDNFAENGNKEFPSVLKLLMLVYYIYIFLSKSHLPWFLMDQTHSASFCDVKVDLRILNEF